MLMLLAGLAVTALPALGMVLVAHLMDRVRQRRDARYARQIELTDAIHEELGAATAPVVTRRLGGIWVVHMMVPFDRPGLVATILDITDRVFASEAAAGRLRIVLTDASPARAPQPIQPRHLRPAAPAAIAAR